MNCPKCNSFVPDGLVSCPICGEPMNAVAETEEKPKVANCGARNVLFFISKFAPLNKHCGNVWRLIPTFYN